MASVKQQKIVLRKHMNEVINGISEEEVLKQSDYVTSKVLDHPQYKSAKSVSIYLSFDKEIQTETLLRDIFNAGKICYIPRFRKGIPDMEMIKLNSIEDYCNLPVNKWNIKQPPDHEERISVFDEGSLDLVLCPGLAFTAQGKRLGRGKGYYDKFLTKCKQLLVEHPYILGLAFKEQILPDVPTTDSDVIIDEVLFDDDVDS